MTACQSGLMVEPAVVPGSVTCCVVAVSGDAVTEGSSANAPVSPAMPSSPKWGIRSKGNSARAQQSFAIGATFGLPATWIEPALRDEAEQYALRLREAGVEVGFTQAGDASHNARKLRQLAGNAVAHGMPWDDALAGLTRVPARTFGVDGETGAVAPGLRADLVLWDGDPLDVASLATRVWFDGRAIDMRSRQTELRDRYLRHEPDAARGELPRAYPADGAR